MEMIQVNHILVKTEEEAKKLKAEIKDGEDFAKKAKEVSLCASGKNGGRLGQFYKGELKDDVFEKAAFALEPGEISAPVKTKDGWHLIYISGKQY